MTVLFIRESHYKERRWYRSFVRFI